MVEGQFCPGPSGPITAHGRYFPELRGNRAVVRLRWIVAQSAGECSVVKRAVNCSETFFFAVLTFDHWG